MKRWHTREDSGLRLDKEGRWWHDDELVEHPKVIEAFNRGLSRADDGRYRLDFGSDWCFVQVDDCAFRVLVVDGDAQTGLSVRLSDRTSERLNLESLEIDEEGILRCVVKGGRAKARFSREAQAAMGPFLEEENDAFFVRWGSQRFHIPLRSP